MRSRTDDHDPLAVALSPPYDESSDARAIRVSREEEALRVSQAIDESIRIEQQMNKKNKIVRILLLGQSESGARHFPARSSGPLLLTLTSRQVHDTAS
jgi:guanine nucleotide-binding protein subunit alpha